MNIHPFMYTVLCLFAGLGMLYTGQLFGVVGYIAQ